MTYQSDFILKLLRNLQSRAKAAAKKHPGLRHMLVLPPGESICVPSRSGPRPLGGYCRPGCGSRKRQPPARKFGETELVGPLPPRSSWPKGIEPSRAVVAGRSFVPNRANVLEPYRIHLFFGGSAGAFKRLQALADAVDGIRGDVTRALREDHSPFSDGVFYIDGDILHGVRAARLDSWLCTLHWWAWVWTECPFRTRPQVVYASSTYETDPRDDAVESKLAFSMFDADVLTASAETLALIQRFFDEPPAPSWLADYPYVPKADEMLPADVARLCEQFIGYVTNYLESEKVLRPRAATARPTAPGSSAETDHLEGLEESGGSKNEAAAQIRRYGPALAVGLQRYGCDSEGVLSVVHCAGPGGGGPRYVLPTWEQTKISLQRDVIQLRQANAAPSPQSKAADAATGVQPPSEPKQAPPTRLHADTAPSKDVTPKVAEAETRKSRTKRGRKPDTDPGADKRIADAWSSKRYKTLTDLARGLDLKLRTVRLALDRHRKRK